MSERNVGGRRRPPFDRPYEKYHGIMLDPKTRVFTVTVLGHTRTADHDATALQARYEMLQEYAPWRDCTVCGKSFKPEMYLNERICSDKCRHDRSRAQTLARSRKVVNIERYLSYREGSWIAEPYDAMQKTRYKETFKTEQEAREFIADIMNSTQRYRLRVCKACSITFDPYEQKLVMRSAKCAACGGLPYEEFVRRSKPKGLARNPATRRCHCCGEDFVQITAGLPAYYCESCAAKLASPAPPRTCIRCGEKFRPGSAGASWFCGQCRNEMSHDERKVFSREHGVALAKEQGRLGLLGVETVLDERAGADDSAPAG